jgi:hypothetical protein
MKKIYHSATLLFAATLVGCAALGLPKAETFNQRLAVSISTVAEARNTALVLLKAKKISPDDAQNVQDQANGVRAGLEIARSLARTNPAAAELRLDAARAAIAGLQAYLASREKEKP